MATASYKPSNSNAIEFTATCSASRNSSGKVTISFSLSLKSDYKNSIRSAYYGCGQIDRTTRISKTDNTGYSWSTSASWSDDKGTEWGAKTYNYLIRAGGYGVQSGGPAQYGTEVSVSCSIAAKQSTVTFNENWAGGGPSTTQTETYGQAWVFPADPVRSGYAFTGWNTAPDGTGTTYASGDIVEIVSDLTLYAQWEPMSILHVVSEADEKTITNIKVVESGTVRNIISCYSVEGGVVRQGVK